MTRVWVVRATDPLPQVECEEWPLGTDEPVFQYGDVLVFRDQAEADQRLLRELCELGDEVQAAITEVTRRIAARGEA